MLPFQEFLLSIVKLFASSSSKHSELKNEISFTSVSSELEFVRSQVLELQKIQKDRALVRDQRNAEALSFLTEYHQQIKQEEKEESSLLPAYEIALQRKLLASKKAMEAWQKAYDNYFAMVNREKELVSKAK
jgi:hypothetical protein